MWMKRKTAREILADSFRELAKQTNVDRITVKAIADNCGYSQATFYRQFRDKYDLIAWDYSRRVGEIMDDAGTPERPWRDTLLDGAVYFRDHRDYLANLFLNTGGLDSFVRNMVETNYTHLRACVMRAMDGIEPDAMMEMYMRVYCHGTVDLVCEWVLGRHEASAGQLAEVFENALPAPLRRYLIPE